MAIMATTVTILPTMITMALHPAHLMDLLQALQALQAAATTTTTATIKDAAFTMAQNYTMDPQEARYTATTAMALIMVSVPMALAFIPTVQGDLTNPAALVALLVAPLALMVGPETCHLHMSTQLEPPGVLLAITMAPNTAHHQKGLDIDVVAMVPECTMAVLLMALGRMDSDPQVVMNPMVHFMDIMGPMDIMDR